MLCILLYALKHAVLPMFSVVPSKSVVNSVFCSEFKFFSSHCPPRVFVCFVCAPKSVVTICYTIHEERHLSEDGCCVCVCGLYISSLYFFFMDSSSAPRVVHPHRQSPMLLSCPSDAVRMLAESVANLACVPQNKAGTSTMTTMTRARLVDILEQCNKAIHNSIRYAYINHNVQCGMDIAY